MRAIKRPSPVQRKARWAGPSLALWPVLPWVLRSLEPCLALSLVPQSAQRKSGREERSRRPLRQGDGRQRSGPLLPRNAAHRKERRRLKSLRARVEALRLNRGELHHNVGGGSQRITKLGDCTRVHQRQAARGKPVSRAFQLEPWLQSSSLVRASLGLVWRACRSLQQ